MSEHPMLETGTSKTRRKVANHSAATFPTSHAASPI